MKAKRIKLAEKIYLGFPLIRDFSYIEGRSLHGLRIETELGDK